MEIFFEKKKLSDNAFYQRCSIKVYQNSLKQLKILAVLLSFFWGTLLADSLLMASELLSLKASFPQISEYDCSTPHSAPKSQDFSLPGEGTLVVKLWVKPHIDPAAHGPFWMTIGNEPLYRYLELSYSMLTINGSHSEELVNGKPYYWEKHYTVKKALTHCKAIINPPESGCQQWKQVVHTTLEYYPPGITPSDTDSDTSEITDENPDTPIKTCFEGNWSRSENGKVVEIIKIARSGATYTATFHNGVDSIANSTATGQLKDNVLELTSNNSIHIKMTVTGNRLKYDSYNNNGSYRWGGSYTRTLDKPISVRTRFEGNWSRLENGNVVEIIKISRSDATYTATFHNGLNNIANSSATGQLNDNVLELTSNNSIHIKITVTGNQLKYDSYNTNGSYRWGGSYNRVLDK